MKEVRQVFAREVLRSYAARGMFRAFNEPEPGHFRFDWLWGLPFDAVVRRNILTFRDVLPHVPATVDAGIRGFVKECASKKRPPHRRYAAPKISRLKGALSFSFQVKDADSVRRAVNLVNEVFLMYLNVEQTHYVAEHLHESDD